MESSISQLVESDQLSLIVYYSQRATFYLEKFGPKSSMFRYYLKQMSDLLKTLEHHIDLLPRA